MAKNKGTANITEMEVQIEEFEEKYEEFEDKIWRNTLIHSVIPLFFYNE